MALSKGVNSYVTRSEADVYFGDRLDVADWTNATTGQKDQALVTATGLLDNLVWEGTISDESQSLAFPRNGDFFDPRLGGWSRLDGVAVPDRVIRATYELAVHLIVNDGILDSTGSAENISVGSIQISTIKNPSVIPSLVRAIIKPLLINGGSRGWWRAN